MAFTLNLYNPLFIFVVYIFVGIFIGRLCYKYNWWRHKDDIDQQFSAIFTGLGWIGVLAVLCFVFPMWVFCQACTVGIKKKE